MPTKPFEFPCPWCGRPNTIQPDPAEAGQILTQDCRVCCNPIEIALSGNEGDPPEVRREGD